MVVGEEVASGRGVEVFPLGSSAGITAVGLLAMPASSIMAKGASSYVRSPLRLQFPKVQEDPFGWSGPS
jgi:hypothetical protein